MASLSYFAIGQIRSWSSSGIPSLQGKDGRNATLSQGPLPLEITSWISKFTHTARGPHLAYYLARKAYNLTYLACLNSLKTSFEKVKHVNFCP
jgi:hypothetical protein